MQKQSWLVVADASEATFYKYTDGGTDLQTVTGIANGLAHKQDQDIVTDRPGVMSGGGSNIQGKDAMRVETTPADKAKEDFVKQLVERLEMARKEDILDTIDIIAEPQIMGLIRQSCSSQLSKLFDREVSKNANQKSAQELLEIIKQ